MQLHQITDGAVFVLKAISLKVKLIYQNNLLNSAV